MGNNCSTNADILLKEGERIAALGQSYNIITSKIHSFGTDAVLLADFARPSKKHFCCDFGTGCGIIPMLWQVWSCGCNCSAVEIQPEGIDMLNRSIRLNQSKMTGEIYPVCADIRNLKGSLNHGCYDVITCNPPYFRQNNGIANRDTAQNMTRHDVTCTLNDVAIAAKKLLKTGGRLNMCNRPDRLIDTIEAMRSSKIEPKRLRFVQQRIDKAPWLFLIEGKKGAKSGLTIMPTLIVEDAQGNYSDEMKKIYGEFGV